MLSNSAIFQIESMEQPPVVKPPQLTPADLNRLSYLRSLQPARSASIRASSKGDRIADIVTETVGSWRFIIIQSCLLAILDRT